MIIMEYYHKRKVIIFWKFPIYKETEFSAENTTRYNHNYKNKKKSRRNLEIPEK